VRSTALLAALLVACACARPRPPDVAAGRAALQEADRAFNRATAERRTEGWTEFFADDGAMMLPTGTITGQAAIRERMAKAFADTSFTLTWEPQQADVGAAGDLGYTLGRSEARFRDEQGRPVVRTGRYLTVWKKQPDGSWKVARDIGVQDPPQARPGP